MMTLSEQIVAAAAFVIAAVLAVMSIRSFRNKGFLFNNAFLYATKEEREAMDKKPYYRQSAIVFLLLSAVFSVVGFSLLLADTRINLLEIPLLLAVVIYATVSSVQISRKEKS